jgi:acetyl-CoA C-acetyltransferase
VALAKARQVGGWETAMSTPETTPVIVGVGEYTERPASLAQSREPVALMVEAMRAANNDAGGKVLRHIETLDLVGLVSWRYRDPVSLLCEKLAISPARKTNASMGGETPIRLLHEAALAIARGEIRAAAIVGGEASSSRAKASRAGGDDELPWTAPASAEDAVKYPSSSFALSNVARQLRVWAPAQIYPFYEMATQAAWGQTPQEAQAQSARLWSGYAAVAAENPFAWNRRTLGEEAIATIDDNNRMINWPYPKLMVANPSVNQAASVIVASLALARELGVPESQCVHIWGGAAAREPEDYLLRDSYAHSTAQTAVLDAAKRFVGGDARKFDKLELYSCFPVVPKMALRTLGLDPENAVATVAGGLTFFGGPLNNYMSHAVCAMVREMRADPKAIGLLYGQGGYVNKHHALIVSNKLAEAPLGSDYSVQAEADAARGSVPKLREDYAGPARIETYTVLHGRDGKPVEGIVIALTPQNERVMARVPGEDAASLSLLLSWEKNAIGAHGEVSADAAGKPVWGGTARV